jgi:hypothetical protein
MEIGSVDEISEPNARDCRKVNNLMIDEPLRKEGEKKSIL